MLLPLLACAARQSPVPEAEPPAGLSTPAVLLSYISPATTAGSRIERLTFDGQRLWLQGEGLPTHAASYLHHNSPLLPNELWGAIYADAASWSTIDDAGRTHVGFLMQLVPVYESLLPRDQSLGVLQSADVRLLPPQYQGSQITLSGVAASTRAADRYARVVAASPCLLDPVLTPEEPHDDGTVLFTVTAEATGWLLRNGCAPEVASDWETFRDFTDGASQLTVDASSPDVAPVIAVDVTATGSWEALWAWLSQAPALPVQSLQIDRHDSGVTARLSVIVRQPAAEAADRRALDWHVDRQEAAVTPEMIEAEARLKLAGIEAEIATCREGLALLGQPEPELAEDDFPELELRSALFSATDDLPSLEAVDEALRYGLELESVALVSLTHPHPEFSRLTVAVSGFGTSDDITARIAGFPGTSWTERAAETREGAPHVSGLLTLTLRSLPGPLPLWPGLGQHMQPPDSPPSPFAFGTQYEELLQLALEPAEGTPPPAPLQVFPTRRYRYHGWLQRGDGRTRGLVADPSGRQHVVEEGTHVGRDWGRLTALGEQAVVLDEYKDDTGTIISREHPLALAEGEPVAPPEVALESLNIGALQPLRRRLARYSKPISVILEDAELEPLVGLFNHTGVPVQLDPALAESDLSVSLFLENTALRDILVFTQLALLEHGVVLDADMVFRRDPEAAATLRAAVWETRPVRRPDATPTSAHLASARAAGILAALRQPAALSGPAPEAGLSIQGDSLTTGALLTALDQQLAADGRRLVLYDGVLVVLTPPE